MSIYIYIPGRITAVRIIGRQSEAQIGRHGGLFGCQFQALRGSFRHQFQSSTEHSIFLTKKITF